MACPTSCVATASSFFTLPTKAAVAGIDQDIAFGWQGNGDRQSRPAKEITGAIQSGEGDADV